MKIIRTVNEKEMEFTLTPEELSGAYNENLFYINRDYITEDIEGSDDDYLWREYRATREQIMHLIDEITDEFQFQKDMFGYEDADALDTAISHVLYNKLGITRW